MTHARPDIPQPDPIVHDRPGDLPQVPCPDDEDDDGPTSVGAKKPVAEAELHTR